MTTLVDSFDAARLDSFIESRNDARNLPSKPGRFVFIAWLDHARSFRLTVWAKSVSDPGGLGDESGTVVAGWTDIAANPLYGGGGPVIHVAPYSDSRVLQDDIDELRNALRLVDDAGHNSEELFSLIVVQAESPNIFSNVTFPVPLFEPFIASNLVASGTNIAGKRLLGEVVDPIEHVAWQEDAREFDFVEFFFVPNRPEGEEQRKAAAYGRPPGGGPNFPTESVTRNRVKVLDASSRAIEIATGEGSTTPETITNLFFPFVRPNAWAHRNVGAIVEAQKQQIGSSNVGVGSFFGDRWYQWFAQQVSGVAATLPAP